MRRPRTGERREGPAPVAVVEVVDLDADGELWVRRASDPESPTARLAPGSAASGGAPGLGDRLLARFSRAETGEVEARLIKRLGQSAHQVLGVVRKRAREAFVEPVDRRARHGLLLAPGDGARVRDGDLVLARPRGEPGPRDRRRERTLADLVEVVGREDDARAASLIAVHAHGVPMGFPEAAEAEARAARPIGLGSREDLRDLPLVTIDPADARDHDDAVFAQADDDPRNPGGWIVWVAIADVAAYVTAGSALDEAAREKGNSVYFPDRVEPMLPEALSADLCSLREGEDRPCLAVRMVFAGDGRRLGHRFVRGLMRSAAFLTYEAAQAAIDGAPDARTTPLLGPALRPLWAAFAALSEARGRRSPLEIAAAERRIEMDQAGRVVAIRPRPVLPAHVLIEEMMIQANVCAAETLERSRAPLIFRVHEPPSEAKLIALADFLRTLDIPWTRGESVRTERFNRLLRATRAGPNADIVNEVVLRSQSQAVYSTDNLGHFGLNLDRYCHFTSPIRRYADLTVHRALIAAIGGTKPKIPSGGPLQLTAQHLTMTERRGMAAERDAADRYVAAFLKEREGAVFEGRITGVTRFGLFVRLAETGADGLVPIASLGDDYFHHDEVAHALVGERRGERWRLGRRVEVRLREAAPVTGGLLLEMLSDAEARAPRVAGEPLKRGRRQTVPRKRPGGRSRPKR